MRRFTRHLFTICSALSLLLCVVICVLWVRGHWAMDVLQTQNNGKTGTHPSIRQTVLSSTIGQVNFIRSGMDGNGGNSYGLSGAPYGWHRSSLGPSWHAFNRYSFSHLGFAWGMDLHGYTPTHPMIGEFQWFISLPNWFLAIASAVGPALWIGSRGRMRRQRYRLAHHLCLKCGYDLRASPERCPECGTPVTK